jgi:hypothetical protein
VFIACRFGFAQSARIEYLSWSPLAGGTTLSYYYDSGDDNFRAKGKETGKYGNMGCWSRVGWHDVLNKYLKKTWAYAFLVFLFVVDFWADAWTWTIILVKDKTSIVYSDLFSWWMYKLQAPESLRKCLIQRYISFHLSSIRIILISLTLHYIYNSFSFDDADSLAKSAICCFFWISSFVTLKVSNSNHHNWRRCKTVSAVQGPWCFYLKIHLNFFNCHNNARGIT